MFNRHHGPTGDATVLVAHGASKVFNPTLPQSVIDRALEKDRARAMAEYLAEFRTDVEGFVALEVARLVSATIASSNLLPVSHMKDSAIPQAEAKIISRSQSLIATTATTQSSSTLKGIMIMKIITIVTAVTAGLVAMLSVAAAARRAPRKGPAIMPRR
jgi:hypothetical protein